MKTKISKVLALSGMAGLLCVSMGSVLAAGDHGIKHSSADFNKDGMVTEDELVTYVRVQFMKMDKNNDHMVANDEWWNDWDEF